jgi:excisionase family DNA binding protein
MDSNCASNRQPLLVSKKESAVVLSVCPRTIDNLIAAKQLPTRRIGRRVLIPYSALVRFAQRDHVGAPEVTQ